MVRGREFGGHKRGVDIYGSFSNIYIYIYVYRAPSFCLKGYNIIRYYKGLRGDARGAQSGPKRYRVPSFALWRP